MNDSPQVLLEHHLKHLKLPTFLREYKTAAVGSAVVGVIDAKPDACAVCAACNVFPLLAEFGSCP